MDETYQKFKVLIIGDSNVGKTSLLIRHADDRFNPDPPGTIGIDYRQKTYIRDKKRYDLHIWDTAGQERFRNVTSAYYRDADAAFIVFDRNNPMSFTHVPYWIQTLRDKIGTDRDPVLILIGNKSDLPSEIKHDTVQKLATEYTLSSYIETSAKSGAMVDQMFDVLLEKLIAKHANRKGRGVITLNDTVQRNTTKCC